MSNRAFILSALIAGLVMGLLGNLVPLNLINCLLCLWIWLGAIFAVFLYRRFSREQPYLTPGQGAGLGAVAGLVAVVFGSCVLLVTAPLAAPVFDYLWRLFQLGSENPFLQAGFGDMLAPAAIFFCLNLLLYPLFGAIGGLIGSGLIWKKPKEVI